ncbi:glycoside hydrolase family 3 domain protein [Cordyceps javanica]|nr:glycoside hydrolase family 3 domain protein [Cordyceps javanica]
MRVRHTQSNGAATHDAQEWVREKLTSDGPVGVRGGTFVDGISAGRCRLGKKSLLRSCRAAHVYSQEDRISLAATWDLELLQRLCGIIVTEAKSKEVDVILGPTVCIPRTPLGGRNFEAYSEDFFLTEKLASTFINAIQACGIASCIKHFAATDQKTRRFFVDARIPDRVLRDIHLQPFQVALRDSSP